MDELRCTALTYAPPACECEYETDELKIPHFCGGRLHAFDHHYGHWEWAGIEEDE